MTENKSTWQVIGDIFTYEFFLTLIGLFILVLIVRWVNYTPDGFWYDKMDILIFYYFIIIFIVKEKIAIQFIKNKGYDFSYYKFLCMNAIFIIAGLFQAFGTWLFFAVIGDFVEKLVYYFQKFTVTVIDVFPQIYTYLIYLIIILLIKYILYRLTFRKK